MAATPLGVFFADSHLQIRAWKDRDISGDSYYSLKQIVDFAIKYKVQGVFGAGDLLDQSTNPSDPIVDMNQQVERLAKQEIPFYFIEGQHEMQDRPWLHTHPWPLHINGQHVSLRGSNGIVQIFGLDFHPSPQLQIALPSIVENTDILLCHQVWSEFMGSVASPQGSLNEIPTVSTVFTGDYHVQKRIEVIGRDGQKIQVISPGSTCMQSIDEPVDKYFYVLMTDGEWKRVKLKTRRLLKYQLSNQADIDLFMQNINADLDKVVTETAVGYEEFVRKPLMHIVYSYRLAEFRGRLQRAVNGRAFIFWKELSPELAPEVVARRKEASERGEARAATLSSELDSYLEQTNQLDCKADCTRLLDAENVVDELRRMRDEALA